MEGTMAAAKQDTECRLWLQYRESKDTGARNRLVLHYEGLVKSIALQIIRGHFDDRNLDDLVSEGLIALIDAVERFDPSYQVNFRMFASIKIKGAMLDFFRRETPGYKRRIAQKLHQMQDAREQLVGKLLREPAPQEMADHLGMPLDEYHKELGRVQSVKLVSLDVTEWQQDAELSRLVDTKMFSDPAAYAGKKELEEILTQKIRLLNQEQQLVLSLFYTKGLKINEVAQVLDMDPVRVSQIRYQAVRRLKRSMKPYVEESE